ncbi:hypothetical protein GCM10023149_20880 [Mucilaginibacter gynuensis]|uniref:Tetratricopeptide repeat protein n=1 Tax=Mucilaginibacter gynuensis TaxID=1302236 RepID=A0ABP8GBJ9_9SPHI
MVNKPQCKSIPLELKNKLHQTFRDNPYRLKRNASGRERPSTRTNYTFANLRADLFVFNEYFKAHHPDRYKISLPSVRVEDLYQAFGSRKTERIPSEIRDLLCYYAFWKPWNDCSQLLGEIEPDNYYEPKTISHRDSRKKTSDAVVMLDQLFWASQTAVELTIKEKVSYLFENNTSFKLLPRIIAQNAYVSPADELMISDNRGNQILKSVLHVLSHCGQNSILRISASMGDGKSTLVWHLAKKWSTTFHVCFFSGTVDEDDDIYFADLPSRIPVVIIIDNCAQFPLSTIIEAAEAHYKNHVVYFVFADQAFRFNGIEEWEELIADREIFDLVLSNTPFFLHSVFELLKSHLQQDYSIVPEKKLISAEKGFFRLSSTETLVDKIEVLLNSLGLDNGNKRGGKDWLAWQQSTVDQNGFLQGLFGMVATFYQFGMSVPLGVFSREQQEEIIWFLSPRDSDTRHQFPIILENDSLWLRHESSAHRYLKIPAHRNLAIRFFKNQLTDNTSIDYQYLLRNIYWKRPFKESFIFNSFPSSVEFYESCLATFHRHLRQLSPILTTESNKTQVEMAKVYTVLGRRPEAFSLLLNIIQKNHVYDVHARTLLLSMYLDEALDKQYQALKLLIEALAIAKESLIIKFKIHKVLIRLSTSDGQFSSSQTLYKMLQQQLIDIKTFFKICHQILEACPSTENNRLFPTPTLLNYLLDRNDLYAVKSIIVLVENALSSSLFSWVDVTDSIFQFIKQDNPVDNKAEMIEAWAAKFERNGQRHIALTILRVGKITKPFYETNKTLISNYLIRNKRYRDCIKLFSNTSYDQLHISHSLNLFKAYLSLDEWDQAERCVDNAIEYQPANKHQKILVGALFFAASKNAIPFLNRLLTHCLSNFPENQDLQLWRFSLVILNNNLTVGKIDRLLSLLAKENKLQSGQSDLIAKIQKRISYEKDTRLSYKLIILHKTLVTKA